MRISITRGKNRLAPVLLLVLFDALAGGALAPAEAAGWRVASPLSGRRVGQATALLPDGTVLVAGGYDGSALATAEIYDPAAGSWRPTASLLQARNGGAAVVLSTGKVLVAGGSDGLAFLETVEVYDPQTGTWSPAAPMTMARQGHTLTVLMDGRVLASGGRSNGPTSLPLATEVYDPVAGTWSATPGSLAIGHADATATRLADGRVLVAGGSSGPTGVAVAEIFDPASGQWMATASMNAGRSRHSATLLRDGTVLAAGGFGSADLSSAEVYDPVAGTWSLTPGTLAKARSQQTAALLPNGKVLVAGGFNSTDGALALTETFDPVTRTWSTAGSMGTARYGASGVLLPGGRVLVAAGAISSSFNTAMAEIYDPALPSRSATGSLSQARSLHVATLLGDGRVLVAGGTGTVGTNGNSTASAEIYDPVARVWATTGSLNQKRNQTTATLLADGRVLVAGGYGDAAYRANPEVFDPTTETWTLRSAMAGGRSGASATLLGDGRVLVAGGSGIGAQQAEVYDPKVDAWTLANGMAAGHSKHTATLLADGRVLVAGGFYDPAYSAEIYDPVTNTWATTGRLGGGASIPGVRNEHTATLLANGTVLVAGGSDGIHPLASAEIYDPATGTWSATGSMWNPRYQAAATLLLDGRVLISGGLNDSGELASTEIYDPASRTWSLGPSLLEARRVHSATLLRSGEVLIAGGIAFVASPSGGAPTLLASAELFDPGLGYEPAARPMLDPVSELLLDGNVLSLTGVGLRARSEASGGNGSQNTAVDGPWVQLRRLDNGLVRWVAADPAAPWSDTAFSSTPLVGLQPGPALLTVFATGVPSASRFVTAECPAPVIDVQPSPLTVTVNQPADFSVTAHGAGLSYRWRRDGAPIVESADFVGTATASLRLPRAHLADAGPYDVVVTSACSSGLAAASTAATLEVLPATSLAVVVAAVENGLGQVAVDPASAICGDASVTGPDVTCTYPFASGDTVTLTATAGADSAFDGWTGACTGLGPTCVVTEENVITTRATFRGPQTLHVDVASLFGGSGSVVVTPGSRVCTGTPNASTACDFQYAPRTALTLVAQPSPGSSFLRWRVACAGAGSCGVTLSDDKTVGADFEVPNQPPVASAGPDQTVEAGTTVVLDAAGSSDPDGGPLTYSWTNANGSVVGTSATVAVSAAFGARTFTLRVTDNRGSSATDSVVVTGLDTVPPAVVLDVPEGTLLAGGASYIVHWTATDAAGLSGFDLLFSVDGTSFGAVPGCTNVVASARQCAFLVPPITVDPAFLRVVARDVGGNTTSDDATVAITTPITVTGPGAGVTWVVGSTQTVTWTSTIVGSVFVELSRNGGGTWTSLGTASATAGSFNWTVSGATTTNARVRVRSTTNSGYADTNDGSFTIAAPLVTVTSPNTTEPWRIGTLRTITWTHNLGVSATFSVEVTRNNGATWTVIQTGVASASASTGSLNWVVSGPTTTTARIRVKWTSNTAISDQSDVLFPITF